MRHTTGAKGNYFYLSVSISSMNLPISDNQISRHNHRVLNPTNQQVAPPECNCRRPPCPLNGACISNKSVIYKATVEEIDNNNNNNNKTNKHSKNDMMVTIQHSTTGISQQNNISCSYLETEG